MNLFDVIANSQNGASVQQMSRQFGVAEGDMENVIKQFLPALTNGMKRNITQNQEGGLDGLMGALDRGGHDRYLDDPQQLGQQEAVAEGNNILGHLLGDKDISRQLAGRTAQSTGMDSGMLQQMLPLIANMVMGAMSKQTHDQNLRGSSAANQSDTLNPLLAMLDADGDGSVIDDMLGLAAKFLR